GIAGPAGGSLQKPVGTVFISVSGEKRTMVRQFHFKGMRGEIREQTADAALTMLTEFLEGMN
ncbi:MAG TPA: competence protein ComA, partial [Thermoplasmata archaeon]|nr:competence protein ComA [Thermoplasmata archaeon]